MSDGTAEPADLAQLRQLIHAGRHAEALARAQAVADAHPRDARARYWSGVAWLLNDQPAQALPHLEFATAAMSGQVAWLSNLGEARRRLGNPEGAIEALRQAVRLQPGHEKARYNLGCALFDKGAFPEAARQFRSLTSRFRDNASYRAALGDALRKMGKMRRALVVYRRAVRLEPDHARANANLGLALLQAGRTEDALERCRRAAELAPGDYRVHFNLARCHVESEALDEAMQAYARAHDLAPANAELNTAIGDVWRSVGEPTEAAFWYAKALAAEPAHARARAGQALLQLDAGDAEGAVAALRALTAAHPDDWRLHADCAQALWDEGETGDAIAALRAALALRPESAALHARIGSILASAGKIDEAVAEHEAALRLNPRCVPALNGLAVTQRGKLDAGRAAQIEEMLARPKLRDGARGTLHAGLAAYHDAKHEAAAAATHAREANRCQWAFKSRRGWEYEPEGYARHIDELMAAFTPEHFQRVAGWGLPDATPVFVVGMPRSGTTLTEQILASHSQVLGVGERSFAATLLGRFRAAHRPASETVAQALAQAQPQEIRALAAHYLERLEGLKRKLGKPQARYVVDKMPENYALVGWILTLFPNARILHARRDLRDVAWSCWITQFGQIRWACRMDHIAQRIRQHLRIMAHWDRVLPGRIRKNDYEALVASQEPQSRQLIEWLGLDWEPACLQFHKTDRIVRTASVSQVRSPIYTGSVARWKPYEAELGPVIEVMREAGVPGVEAAA